MSIFDYGVIVCYLLFITSLGFIFRKFSSDSSDFFRGGGNMLWWLVGATAFMTQFSAWTFTGAAGYAYSNGTMIMVIFIGNAFGYFCTFLFSAARFRQMRVVTPMEAIRDRYGKVNEQFFTWVWLPIGIFYAGIWLTGISSFVSVVFGMDLKLTILAVGLVVLFMASLGGSWAVVASDFMQVMILIPISMVAAFLAIQAVGDGSFASGAATFTSKLPEHHFDWTILLRPQIIIFWVVAMIIKQFSTINNLNDSYRFLFAKDTRNARKAGLLASLLFLFGPIIWFIPPMAAAILYPDLSAIPELSTLNNMADGAYVAIGLRTMPMGMIGLMVSAIFAATISSMDSGLNKSAGIFIRNFYKPVLRKDATETEYLVAAKIVTAVFGLLVISASLLISTSDLGLFDVMQLFSANVAIPFVIPLIWGFIIKKSPAWSAWSTVIFGFVISLFTTRIMNPEIIRGVLGLDSAFTDVEYTHYLQFIGLLFNVILSSLWFLGTVVFSRYNSRDSE
ncbi:MAG: transporter [candidate division KSB1 bacterium]|nr:transporter [candidate division KSB1 bacterium]